MSRQEAIQLELDVTCQLDEDHFGEWEKLSPEIKEWWENQIGGTGCEGGGLMGTWCSRCQFCSHYDIDRVED